jgi:hypothetical protein
MKKQKQTVVQFNLFSNLLINEKINLKSWNRSKDIKEIVLSHYDKWFDDAYFTKRDYIQWKKSNINRKWVKGWKINNN